MKYILLLTSCMFSLNIFGMPAYTRDFYPTVNVKDNSFHIFYQNAETKKITLKVYSQKGDLIKASELKTEPWKHFKSYNITRREFFFAKEKMYTIKYPSFLTVLSKQELKGLSCEKKEKLVDSSESLINLAKLLPKTTKVKSLHSPFLNKNILITTCSIKQEMFFYVFNLKGKDFFQSSLSEVYKIGWVHSSLFTGCQASRILKYADGYILVWKKMPWDNLENNDKHIAPIYFTYLNLKNKTISKYIIADKISIPVKLSIGLNGDILCTAYNQLNKQGISEIKTKFINLKDLLKQKPVSVSGPEKLDKKEAVPQK